MDLKEHKVKFQFGVGAGMVIGLATARLWPASWLDIAILATVVVAILVVRTWSGSAGHPAERE